MFYCAIYRDKLYWKCRRLIDISHTYRSIQELHRNNDYRRDRLIEVLSTEDKMQFNHLIKAAIKRARTVPEGNNDLKSQSHSSTEGDTSATA